MNKNNSGPVMCGEILDMEIIVCRKLENTPDSLHFISLNNQSYLRPGLITYASNNLGQLK